MALGHNPRVVTDGLVFYYDMGNKKSWKGAPTVNLIDTDLSTYSKNNGCTVVDTERKYEGQPIYRAYFTSGTLPQFYTTFTHVAGQTVTPSIYYRFISGHDSGEALPGFVLRETGFGTSYSSEGFLPSTEWQRKISQPETFAVDGTCMFLIHRSSSSTTVPIVMEFTMPQLEERDFATSFVDGERTTTESILDLTGNGTVNFLSGTVFTSDNKFTFDRSDHPATMSTIHLSDLDYTVEAIIKRNVINQQHGILSDLQYGWWGFYVNSDNVIRLIHKNQPLGSITNSLTGTIPIGLDYTHVVGTFNQLEGMQVYVDGVLDNSNADTRPFHLTTSGRGPRWIGQYRSADDVFSNGMNGEIPILKVYKGRALTGEEVKNNFNAIRGRFGI